MVTSQTTAPDALKQAQIALQRGEKLASRRWAALAAKLDPRLEEPWLILAALSKPDASVAYLEQALRINPASQRAQKGMEWAKKRQAQASGLDVTAPALRQSSPVQLEKTAPIRVRPQQAQKPLQKPAPRSWFSIATVGLAVGFLFVGMLGVLWVFSRPSEVFASAAQAGLPQIGLLPTATDEPSNPVAVQFTPTPFLPGVATPLPPETQPAANALEVAGLPTLPPLTDSATTDEPAPDGFYTVQAGDTLFSIASRFDTSPDDLASFNEIIHPSALLAGQQLRIPPPKVIEPPAPQASQKRILVDISEQHMYVYDGDDLVYSFIISTGIGNSTRVGTFEILDKIPNAYGSTWNIWMPDWMGIYWSGHLENGIHSLPILSNGARLWDGYLGAPVSYGCVVLGATESQLLYNWAEVGTPVIIQY